LPGPWGDERFVPDDHPESNYRMTREAMLAKAPVPPENIHPVLIESMPDDAAARYEQTMAFVADAQGVHRLDSAHVRRGSPPVPAVMGVSGAGKTTIALELAAGLGWAFGEGDALHPESNVAKMHAGVPLAEQDRWPWLDRVAVWIDEQRAEKQPGIITCSALKKACRQRIIGDLPEVRLVYLRDLIARHLEGREGHFMPKSLLQSQIDTLEEPGPDKDPPTVDVGGTPGEVAQEIIRLLATSAPVR
jgi:carbohydrate kinase (thermoresistant glucokinase family)